MKKLVLITTLILSTTWAQAAEPQKQKLECRNGDRDFESFSAELDYTPYVPGSNYFLVRNAHILNNYATARLICAGHTLGDISCVGFWFDVGSQIVHVKVSKKNGDLVANSENLTSSAAGIAQNWKCQVK